MHLKITDIFYGQHNNIVMNHESSDYIPDVARCAGGSRSFASRPLAYGTAAGGDFALCATSLRSWSAAGLKVLHESKLLSQFFLIFFII